MASKSPTSGKPPVNAEGAALALYNALRSLTNEASGFIVMADRETHGNTNIACL